VAKEWNKYAKTYLNVKAGEKRVHRFFVEPGQIIGDSITLLGTDAHHIADVLRLSFGQRIIVCDGEGYEYEGNIVSCSKDKVTVQVVNVKKSVSEPPLRIILAQGMPKRAESFELVIQKATELGVARLVPLISERTVVRLKEDKLENRLSRWSRIALEAAKQSQRGKVPEVDQPLTLTQFLDTIPRDALCLIPWEMEQTTGVKEVLKWELNNGFARTVVVLIGPEGGFSPGEIDEATRAGVIPVSLGPRILRTETAGIITLGIIQYELGDLGGARGD